MSGSAANIVRPMIRRILRSFTRAGEGMGWLYTGFPLVIVGEWFNAPTAGWIGFACIVVFAVAFFG